MTNNNATPKIEAFSFEDYQPPQWAGQPQSSYRYFFEVVKHGISLDPIPIKSKSFNLVGCLQDLCDIVLKDNPTVSRKHAIIQFKRNQPNPYIFDLNSTHGTHVNKQKLPPRAFQIIKPYDSIKFGVSSRVYILRCPQLQKLNQEKQIEDRNVFMEALQQQNIKLSKQKMKEKYLDLLENDPYYKANNQPRRLLGEDTSKIEDKKVYSGIDWGISDEQEIYGYRNQHEFSLQPDLLRRLPGLDQTHLNKISEFESNFGRYQQIEAQLNQITRKQKQEYGLQQKLQNKKEKLQKKFVQALEAVEKNEQWIRTTLFGQISINTKTRDRRQKQMDSFQDDEFMDRTIQDKKRGEVGGQSNQGRIKQYITTADYWQLQKVLEDKLIRKNELNTFLVQEEEYDSQQQEQQEQEKKEYDELDAFMRENNEALNKQNNDKANNQLNQIQSDIKQLQEKLSISNKDLEKIEMKVLKKSRTIKHQQNQEQQQRNRQKTENMKHLSETLAKLQALKQEADQQALYQDDVNIFKYYQKQVKKERLEQQLQETYKRVRHAKDDSQRQLENEQTFVKPITKYPKLQKDLERVAHFEGGQQQQQYFDLTKLKTD